MFGGGLVGEDGLFVPRTLTKISETNKVCIEIINCNSDPIYLEKGTLVATGTKVEIEEN